MNIPGLPHALSADDSGVWESMLPAGFSFTGAGSVRVAGLDVMGARVFDGASKRFLSTDPLPRCRVLVSSRMYMRSVGTTR